MADDKTSTQLTAEISALGQQIGALENDARNTGADNTDAITALRAQVGTLSAELNRAMRAGR